jgi:serine protease Do
MWFAQAKACGGEEESLMKAFHRGTAWVLTAIGGIFLGAGAAVWSQPQAELPPTVLKTPNDLSLAFRVAAKHVLPAVVAIRSSTKGGMEQVASGDDEGGLGGSGMNDEFLRRFFGEDFNGEQMPNRQLRRYVPPQMGAGSGVIIHEDGVVLTNNHVVASADEVIVELSDGRQFKAESWSTDPRRDIAIVKIKTDGEKLPTAQLGDSDSMEIGDWVLALGNPFNVGTSVTAGIVSATGRAMNITELENFIQTDAAVNPGNSGGPLINLSGQVVGINTAISTNSGGYDGVSFAIPVNMIKGIVDQLVKTGKVQRSYLGVGLQSLSRDLREWYKTDHGALVSMVKPDSPASKADMQVGDVIVEFAGKKIERSADLTALVEGLPADKAQKMVVLRNGEKVELSVTPEQMPEDYTEALKLAHKTAPDAEASHEESALGLQIGTLTDELRERLSTPEGTTGVVVKDSEVGSPAFLAGLRRGNVITHVNSQPVDSPEKFAEIVKGADASRGILLRVMSGGSVGMVVIKPEAK